MNTCKAIAVEHLTLDGVYQAPARSDEDTRNGFAHGGWSVAGDDPKLRQAIGRSMTSGWSLLVGRTTYEDLYEGWQLRQPSSPMTQALRTVRKFVVSRNATYAPQWENSTLLPGEATNGVRKLKQERGEPLIIFGSGVLVRVLLQAQLIDELLLMIHPLVLGAGARLFEGSSLTRMTLSDQATTDTGVVMATYRTRSS